MQSPKTVPQPEEALAAKQNLSDCFDQLPSEMYEIIGPYLSTRDVLNLRRASRAIIPLSQPRILANEFDIHGERGFLAPLVQRLVDEEGRRDMEWRLLCHCPC